MTSDKNGIERYEEYLGPRYQTFLDAFNAFIAIGGRTIVELGTTRSFVSGGHPGCMVNDAKYWKPAEPRLWDWGAGMFTRMCPIHLKGYRPQIHSVDISAEAIEISRVITADVADLITYHHSTSEEFLNAFPEPIDLLYMDAGETGQGAEQLHFREASIVLGRQLLSPRGIVLIDDVNIPGQSTSKGCLSIPLFLQHGFRIRSMGYQVVLQRPSADGSVSTRADIKKLQPG
jgi:hypothetical protein